MPDRHDRRAGPARPGLLAALCALAWAAAPAGAADFDLLTPVPGLTSAVAYGVSADGSVVVGVSYTVSTSNSHRGTRWVRVGGSYTPSSIGVPPGGADSWAFATSADGGVAVGQGTVGSTQAIRWTQATGTTAPLTGFGLSVANDVSADGAVWAGYASVITNGTDYRAV